MPIQISPLQGQTRGGSRFSVLSFNMHSLADQTSPLLMLDDFRVNGHSFPPHPHAGFSAVTYVFEDSASSLRVADSLGNDIQVGQGGIVWTQAGSGVIHQELAASNNRELHGAQFFVNLHASNKSIAPRTMWLDGDAVPVWRNENGDSVRVVVGNYQNVTSPLVPAEPFTVLDMEVCSALDIALGADQQGFIYVQSGQVILATSHDSINVIAGKGLMLEGSGGIKIVAEKKAKLLFFCGKSIHESVMTSGPFVMNSQDQINEATRRYQDGLMGKLKPLS